MLAHQVEAQRFSRDALLCRQRQMAPRDRVKQRLNKHNHRSRLAQDSTWGTPHKSPASLQGLWLREDVKEAHAELRAQQQQQHEDPHDGDSFEDQLARNKPSTGMSSSDIPIGKPRKQKTFSGDFEFLRTPSVMALDDFDLVQEQYQQQDGDMDDDWLCVDSAGSEGLPFQKLSTASRPGPTAPSTFSCKPTFAEAVKAESL